tara:strand:+ start:950 stop:3148 length:2199 start_codon:yes stop_codon:yes gene_type:complete
MARYDTYGTGDDQILEDLDSNFRGFNNRSKPDSLEQGMLSNAQNTRIDKSGIIKKRDAITNRVAPFAIDSNTQFKLSFALINPVAANASATSDRSGTTITLNFTSGHGIPAQSFSYVAGLTTASPLTNFTQSTNYTLTRVSANQLTFVVPDLDGVDIGGAVFTVGGPFLADAQLTEIKASCNYRDPTDNDKEYILLVGNAKAVAVDLSGGFTSTDIDYPAGRFIAAEVNAIQAFDKVYIFEDGQVPLAWDLNLSNDFIAQESGTFTQPTLKSTTNDCSIANGKVTVVMTNTGAGALNVGDEIVILDKGGTDLTNEDSYQIAESSSSQFSFYAEAVDVGSSGAGNGVAIKLIGRVSGGAGFIHAPAPKQGIVHQDRLVIPYEYTVNAGDNSYTTRNVTDEILISYPFNPEKFDTTYGTFVTAGGTNDSFVTAFSFADDKLVIFNRKSIAVVTGINSFNFQQAVVSSVTKELGLVAKDTVVQVANNILFLSDNGVYGASFEDLYNLRGNEMPLSDPINPTIETINKDFWHNSSAVYFNNRYYIAVPTGTSQTNNTLLVFNFLNKAWESVDSVNSTDFDYEKLIVGGSGSNRQVYAISSAGSIHQITGINNDTDAVVVSVGGSTQNINIITSVTTRQYNLGSIDRKKFNNFELVAGGENNANVVVSAELENTDATISELANLSINDADGVSTRGRIGNYRAYGAKFTFLNSSGLAEFRMFKVGAAITFRSTTSTQ